MHRPPTAEAELATELAAVRPSLGPRYTAALPGARAAVLTRLWRALVHEPLPWIAHRGGSAGESLLRLRDGRRLHGPRADPYATTAYVTDVRLDGVAYDDPARLMTELAVPHGAGLAAELGHSVASLALSRAGQEPGPASLQEPGEWPEHDWEWEQRVVDGHPYHPNCRARPGFSVAEQLAYGPEHRPSVRLGLLPVPADECLVSGEWPRELRDGTRLVIPVHPWQAAHVLKRSCEQEATAHPLMSLRTLALCEGPHVKTALSTRLTSSVRDISVGSIAASAALSAFAETLTAHTDGLLHMTRTLGAATANSPIWRPCCGSRRACSGRPANTSSRSPPSPVPIFPPPGPGWRSSPVSRSPSGCGCWSWAWRWRRTARTCWSCCRRRAAHCGWSTVIWPTSGSVRPGWPGTASRCRTNCPSGSARTT